MTDATKTLTDSAVKAGDHVDEHHTKAKVLVAADKSPVMQKAVENEAIKSSEALAKHAVAKHADLTKKIADTTDYKDVAKAAKDSSKDVKKHATDAHAEAHGFDWEMVLIVLLVAFLLGIFLMFLA